MLSLESSRKSNTDCRILEDFKGLVGGSELRYRAMAASIVVPPQPKVVRMKKTHGQSAMYYRIHFDDMPEPWKELKKTWLPNSVCMVVGEGSESSEHLGFIHVMEKAFYLQIFMRSGTTGNAVLEPLPEHNTFELRPSHEADL